MTSAARLWTAALALFAPARLFEHLHRRPWYGATLRDWVAGLDLPAGAAVLEIGCGPGMLCADMAAAGLHPIGLDSADHMIRRARRLHPGLRFIQGRLPDADLAGHSLDAVLCASVLNLVDDPAAFLASAAAPVRVGGSVSALFPTADLDPGAFDLKTAFDRAACGLWAAQSPKLNAKPALRAALKAGLQNVEIVVSAQGLAIMRGWKV